MADQADSGKADNPVMIFWIPASAGMTIYPILGVSGSAGMMSYPRVPGCSGLTTYRNFRNRDLRGEDGLSDLRDTGSAGMTVY